MKEYLEKGKKYKKGSKKNELFKWGEDLLIAASVHGDKEEFLDLATEYLLRLSHEKLPQFAVNNYVGGFLVHISESEPLIITTLIHNAFQRFNFFTGFCTNFSFRYKYRCCRVPPALPGI